MIFILFMAFALFSLCFILPLGCAGCVGPALMTVLLTARNGVLQIEVPDMLVRLNNEMLLVL